MNSRESSATVTVCLPTTGRTKYLEQVVAGLLGQSYPASEVLILDNASPPETLPELERIMAPLPGARFLRIENRVPVFTNFNRGLRAATGKYITYFHDDDVYGPRYLESYIGMLEANPAAVFGGGNFDVIGSDGQLLRRRTRVPATGYWTGRRFIEDLVTKGSCALPTPGLVFRRDAFSDEGFDESLPGNWGDFPIFMRLAERGPVAVSKEAHFSWRVHGENASSIPFSVAIPERTRIFREYLEEYLERHPEEGAFVNRLIRRNSRNQDVGLLWGWLTASSETDAEACRLMIREAPLHVISRGLALLERVGLSLDRRRSAIASLRALDQAVRS